jgi:hypothetical protein
MSKFGIHETEEGRFLVFTPLGGHISGTAHRNIETAQAEIAGWVAGWNASIDRRSIMSWSWDIIPSRQDTSPSSKDET